MLALADGAAVLRTRLSALLWEDRGEEQARNSLRQAFTALRKVFADHNGFPFVISEEDAAIDLTQISVDVLQLGETTAGSEHSTANEVCWGEPLEGLSLSGQEIEHWLLTERQKISTQYCERLSGKIEDLQAAGDLSSAAITAHALLRADPVDEPAHRVIMQAHIEAGEPARALKQFQLCTDALQSGLGLAPGADTVKLAESIRSDASLGIGAANKNSAPRTAVSKRLALPDKPSIAVLPFSNMSGEPEHEYFSDGISEDIITALSKVSKLFVVARNSTFTYKGRAVDVKQVGREQGVQYVLEGSVRRSGNRLRITAQLTDATAGHQIWAQRYDRVVQDVFDLQDELTREVTSALQVELTAGEQAQLWASGTRNLAAWELTMQIQDLLETHRWEPTVKARQLAKQALAHDDGYAAAWTFLGASHWQEAFNGWSTDPESSYNLALDALNRAHSIDDTNSDVYAHLAFLYLSLQKFEEASDLAERSLALGPSNSLSAATAANVALFDNRPDDMVILLEKAMRLCPIYPAWYVGDLAWAHLLKGQLDTAVTIAQEATDLDPDYIYTYIVLAVAQVDLGHPGKAAAAVKNILRIEPNYSLRIFAESQPFRDTAVTDRHLTGLRKAGLPE